MGNTMITTATSIAVSESPEIAKITPISTPIINPRGRLAKITKRVAHQYSDLLDLLWKSFHLKKYALTASIKFIIIYLSFCQLNYQGQLIVRRFRSFTISKKPSLQVLAMI